ncbi:terminus macrodomain insulation protein YfbV [Psychrobium sp. 1_MG-2023]|uniref:terminus macrodomain insulation protein YfbV n=1 Tax=Psychrobium sp. 1_MG-2023 TaxID=3062624 RepID=UPI000C34C35A|nr:terminus macrodomain insulation protein YfbV [Psychrobium sp. 1_MG-2023]MDP2560222.1 terminus macrodomain insulation protein YfbV [Psychrobium sp. 1_MG-2023]PKF57032.1 DUF412 domain-containing protein [Alteromonadales bacterium alter-6D02]
MHELKQLIEQGRLYQHLWPQQRELSAIFPEGRIIALCKLLQKVAPMIASLSFVVQFLYFGEDVIPRALAMSLLVLSIPYQGLIWLGHRSKQPLSRNLLSWCSEVRTQMINAGMSVKPIHAKASYMDMAQLLNDAYSKLNKAFDLP